jgi:hypothetical protein
MRHLMVRTDQGLLYLVGGLHADGRRRATLFVMGGFGPPDDLHQIADWFPTANVLVAPLPGMAGTSTRTRDVTDFARAIDGLIENFVPEGPVVMMGASAGCLATLGTRSPRIVSHVALEPFFHTAPLWPLQKLFQRNRAAGVADINSEQMADALFGITPSGVSDRDYSGLLTTLAKPLDVIVGAEPLEPPREEPALPSLTSEADRTVLAALPGVTIHRGPPGSGHHLMGIPAGVEAVKSVVRAALQRAVA